MSGAVLVSSCKGRVFTTLRSPAEAQWLRVEVLDMAPEGDVYAPALAAACAQVLREIHRGRGAEFLRGLRDWAPRSFDNKDPFPWDLAHLTRRLLELGTIANEAGVGVVYWR